MRVTCPACGTVTEADLTLQGVGAATRFMDGAFAWAETMPSEAARLARCPGCRVRLLAMDAIEILALEAGGLLSPRIAQDRHAAAAKARRAPPGALADVPAALIGLLPMWVAKEWQVVPFRDEGEEVWAATSAYTVGKFEERRLAGFVGRDVRLHAAPEGDIVVALERYYGVRREDL